MKRPLFGLFSVSTHFLDDPIKSCGFIQNLYASHLQGYVMGSDLSPKFRILIFTCLFTYLWIFSRPCTLGVPHTGL